ncbi:3ecccf5f-8478-4a58-9cd5-75a5c67dcb9c [Thermothielavioides terrestris]|uniref:Uncharacterized protein n=2 Tax=Thermothielavioides terrestris TaxID=2587410 RepID=G2R7T6_THETT|nr:uncharacterized protein THITE_2117264 [Thermothielavioides terrestris NRRL 8126]AEO67995.1 hypothetical protein THITE_2117264 [Thermothielavioides terrestris NRRL 8126]SPQ24768.1 3ecccf5f-8478-4a58-9cd5-75a5c67dcb9c [Thermothielavioides terrestris]
MENPPASITIREQRHRQAARAETASSPSSYSSSPSSPAPSPKSPSRPAQKQNLLHSRRPSLLSSAFTRQECTTINIGEDPDGPLRLVTYLSSDQGFVWNPEIFVPSYCNHDYVPLEQRHDPVHEIYLTDEEIEKILPR